MHDFGEGRSGDTGASSYAIRGLCNLHTLEREGLETSLRGLAFQKRALRMWDDFRAYRTPEALLVHVADNLEGFEKGLHASRGAKEILEDAFRVLEQNLQIYQRCHDIDEKLGQVAQYLLDRLLVPGTRIIANAYGADKVMLDKVLAARR